MTDRDFLIAPILLMSAVISSGHAQQSPSAKAEVLLRTATAWNGQAYGQYPAGSPQLSVLKVSVPAHTTLPWHTHPMPTVAYVLSGHITLEDRASDQKHTFRAGDAFGEQVGTVHRGITDEEPAVFIITYAGVAGQPTSVPITGGSSEY